VRPVVTLAMVAGVVYLAWRAAITFGGSNPVSFVALFAGETFGLLALVAFAYLAWRVPPSSSPRTGTERTADVLVCTYDEDIDVLRATLVGCENITYPHVTWVLDDGRRAEVADLARQLGARYLTRPDNSHAKAGNINHALGVTDGDLVLILDADHVPLPRILDATVAYFDEPDVCLVQTPHDFANLDSFQHRNHDLHDQSLFFNVIQPGKDRHNAAFWCGSAAIVRRSALMGVGGVATDTIAEDFHTTIKLHARGWRTRYHPEPLVQGIAPHDLSAFLLQRDRWARGNLSVFRTKENPFTCRGLTLRQRASYLGSLLAYFAPLQKITLMAVLIAMLVGGALPARATAAGFVEFWVPWMALSLLASGLLARGYTRIRDETAYTWLTSDVYSQAALSVFGPVQSAFRVTPKRGVDEGGWPALRQLRVVLVTSSLLAASVVIRLLAGAGVVPLPPLTGLALGIGLFFGVYETLLLGRVMWIVTRRRQRRVHYRVPVRRQGAIGDSLVRVIDLTPFGAAVVSPLPLVRGTTVTLTVDLMSVGGTTQRVPLHYRVSSCEDLDDYTFRLGGAVEALDEAGMRALVEHCELVEPMARLARAATRRGEEIVAKELVGTAGRTGVYPIWTATGASSTSVEAASGGRRGRRGRARVNAERAGDVMSRPAAAEADTKA
jgi:cellulose synthase/poly-beta-1,6-N-acetylglucosamine synthase-like glycosyltransferase